MNEPASPTPPRLIAHLDMDAFYASVELLRRPDLKGQPVAIGGRGDPTRRGVVTTANYEARKFGIHSAMALRKAYELCPQCVFLPVDFDEYRRYSRLFKKAIGTLVERIEDRGIDEVYLDLTGKPEPRDVTGATLAAAIKQQVRDATGLTCSIGLASNKLLAKIASDLDKPDGLTIIDAAAIPARIWPLPARRINGIGPKAEARLAALGIQTIGELAQADPPWLIEKFGATYGRWLHRSAHGLDDRPVVTFSEPVSMSRETTFERDLHPRRDWHDLARILTGLIRGVAHDLQTKGYHGRTIGVKVRYDDFRIVTRDLSLPEATNDPVRIRRAAFECFARIPMQRRLRLVGVRVGNLARASAQAPMAPNAADPNMVREPALENPSPADNPSGPVAPGENLRLFD